MSRRRSRSRSPDEQSRRRKDKSASPPPRVLTVVLHPIRVAKYDWKQHKMPKTDGYKNILVHVKDPLSPYVLRCSGVLMENKYQFSKLYRRVRSQNQKLHRYSKDDGWIHPTEEHYDPHTKTIRDAFWAWQRKGFECKFAVRYPNGYAGRGEVVGSVIGTKDDYRIVDYVTARKEIYYPCYVSAARTAQQFRDLQQQWGAGARLQIVEVDGPRFDAESPPYNRVVNGSLPMTEDITRALVVNTTQSFGHGYCLAISLMGRDEWVA
jgi:hypothetical protein